MSPSVWKSPVMRMLMVGMLAAYASLLLLGVPVLVVVRFTAVAIPTLVATLWLLNRFGPKRSSTPRTTREAGWIAFWRGLDFMVPCATQLLLARAMGVFEISVWDCFSNPLYMGSLIVIGNWMFLWWELRQQDPQ